MVPFTISVKDNDSSACSASTFSLAGSVPSGWSGVLASSALSLSPGGSASTTLNVTSPTGTPNGFYNVSARADNSSAASYQASASGTYVIGTAPTLTITVSTSQASYVFGQTVNITAKVLSGAAPVSGSNVNVTIIKADGSQVALSATTGSNGVATASYKIKRKDPTGTYVVQASTSGTGNAATVGATTSFTVK
jgi:uncharacterized protein YfaS (alpha-2-macroglobulin family)